MLRHDSQAGRCKSRCAADFRSAASAGTARGRVGTRTTDTVEAGGAAQRDDQFAVATQGAPGYLRMRRTGDQWRFAMRAPDSKDGVWTEVGELSAKLSPDVQIWLTAAGVGQGEVKVLLREVTIGKPK